MACSLYEAALSSFDDPRKSVTHPAHSLCKRHNISMVIFELPLEWGGVRQEFQASCVCVCGGVCLKFQLTKTIIGSLEVGGGASYSFNPGPRQADRNPHPALQQCPPALRASPGRPEEFSMGIRQGLQLGREFRLSSIPPAHCLQDGTPGAVRLRLWRFKSGGLALRPPSCNTGQSREQARGQVSRFACRVRRVGHQEWQLFHYHVNRANKSLIVPFALQNFWGIVSRETS